MAPNARKERKSRADSHFHGATTSSANRRRIARTPGVSGDSASARAISLTATEQVFSVLNMRSADLTAAARIRDAAIEQFGQHGFGVGLRTIAEAAGVSAALVIHHYGSKEGLRKACDGHVADEIRDGKSEAMVSNDPANWLGQLAEIESYAPLTAYLVRSLQTGGELAMTMWHRMIENAETYFAEGVQAGTINPVAIRTPGPNTWRSPRAADFCCICKCTTTQRICGQSCATTPATWCCLLSSSTPKPDGRPRHIRRLPSRRQSRR